MNKIVSEDAVRRDEPAVAALHPAANTAEGLYARGLGLGDDLDLSFPDRVHEAL